MSTTDAPVGGRVAKGYEAVLEAFNENLASGLERGGALAVYQDGQKVVDLWGGTARTTDARPWREDTLALAFSLTKGITALATAVAHARGGFDYEQPVAEIWPEFAAGGKAGITVRQVLSQQAGLSTVDKTLSAAVMAEPNAIAAQLASQAPEVAARRLRR